MKLFQKIAQHVAHSIAIRNAPSNYAFARRIFDKTQDQIKEALPSGPGVDDKIRIDYDNSKPERIVLTATFHHMDDNGCYCEWSYHNIVITPSLEWGFCVKITGLGKRNIKEYLRESAESFLNKEV